MISLLGQILVRRTSLSTGDLEAALSFQEQEAPEKRIGQILIERGHVGEGDVGAALAEQWDVPYWAEIPAASIGGEIPRDLPLEFL